MGARLVGLLKPAVLPPSRIVISYSATLAVAKPKLLFASSVDQLETSESKVDALRATIRFRLETGTNPKLLPACDQALVTVASRRVTYLFLLFA